LPLVYIPRESWVGAVLTRSRRRRAWAGTAPPGRRWRFASRSSTASASTHAPSCTDSRIIAGDLRDLHKPTVYRDAPALLRQRGLLPRADTLFV